MALLGLLVLSSGLQYRQTLRALRFASLPRSFFAAIPSKEGGKHCPVGAPRFSSYRSSASSVEVGFGEVIEK